jgi:hypothetical protein
MEPEPELELEPEELEGAAKETAASFLSTQ